MNATLEEIAARIKGAKSVAVLTHMRPDGDAFGSALALSSALETLGIPHCVCDESEIPSNLAFLEGSAGFRRTCRAIANCISRWIRATNSVSAPLRTNSVSRRRNTIRSTSITTSPTPVSQSTISCGNVPRIV